MKRFFSVLFFLLLVIIVHGEQPITIKGRILDAQTREPIPYANIAIVEVQKGTTSLGNGLFALIVDRVDIKGNLNISCLNYADRIIPLSSFVEDKELDILLEPILYDIPEVVIKPQKKISLVVNKLKKSDIRGGLPCNGTPLMYARFFEYNKNDASVNHLSSVQIFSQKWQQKEVSKVRLRFFSVDTISKNPSEDIVHEEIIVSLKKGKINDIDLRNYNITMPKEGVFVAVEWLIIPENEYVWISADANNKTKKQIEYGPILGANYRKESKTWKYWAGKWSHDKISVIVIEGVVFDAAISITLTN